MKYYICNAFSLSMLDRESQEFGNDFTDGLRVPRPVDESTLNEFCRKFLSGEVEYVSAVGHSDTARVFADYLGLPILTNRVSVKLTEGTRALIGQYVGPRLPEGATSLPEGASIEWWVI